MQWNNNIDNYCDNETEYCERLHSFIETNIDFMKSEINKNRDQNSYWHQIGQSFKQLTGLEDGYNFMIKQIKPKGVRIDINSKDLILLNLLTEFLEFEQIRNRTKLS